MKLFTFDCNYIPTEAINYNIGTPLGQVTTYITHLDNIVDDNIAGSTFYLETSARITTFHSKDFVAELLTCRPNYFIHRRLSRFVNV